MKVNIKLIAFRCNFLTPYNKQLVLYICCLTNYGMSWTWLLIVGRNSPCRSWSVNIWLWCLSFDTSGEQPSKSFLTFAAKNSVIVQIRLPAGSSISLWHYTNRRGDPCAADSPDAASWGIQTFYISSSNSFILAFLVGCWVNNSHQTKNSNSHP